MNWANAEPANLPTCHAPLPCQPACVSYNGTTAATPQAQQNKTAACTGFGKTPGGKGLVTGHGFSRAAKAAP
jgi:hypothetical protein